MSLLKNKKGLIMGVANDRSIAWGIAKKLSEHGANLAFTYLSDTLKKRVVPLAESLKSSFILSCDVEKKEDTIKIFNDIKNKWENLDFVVHAIAFSERSELSGEDRKSTRLNSSHVVISYAVFCLKKKKHSHLDISACTFNNT